MDTLRKRFLVSYDLQADYEIGGREYRERSGMHLSNTRVECHAETRARIGTVIYRDSDYWGEYPPPEVMALFPGMVAARYPWMAKGSTVPQPATGEAWRVEYQGGVAPEVVQPYEGTLMWGPRARACADHSYEVSAHHLLPPPPPGTNEVQPAQDEEDGEDEDGEGEQEDTLGDGEDAEDPDPVDDEVRAEEADWQDWDGFF